MTDASWQDLKGEEFESLKGSTPANEASSSKSLADQLDEEHLEELKAARKFRATLVPFTKWTVAGVLVAAVVVMGFYLRSEWGRLAPEVILGFFTSVVVETIGILYIISTYLFPKGGVKRQADSSD